MLQVIQRTILFHREQEVNVPRGARILSAVVQQNDGGRTIVLSFWANDSLGHVRHKLLLLGAGESAEMARFEQYVGPVGDWHLFDLGEVRT